MVNQFGSEHFKAEEMTRSGLSNSTMLYVVEKPDRGRTSG